MTVACGRCQGCLSDRAQVWALRCVHEAQMHEDNCFVTLTYSDANLPKGGSLVPAHGSTFIRDLRRSLCNHRISFYLCGEYGDTGNRPHYHALIFGWMPHDMVLWKTEPFRIFTSAKLEKLWGRGFTSVGPVTFESAAYTARYVLKKVHVIGGVSHYERVDPLTGEIHKVEPEFARMSLNPAIGKRWYAKFKQDAFPSDFVTHGGEKWPVPKYYYTLLKRESESEAGAVKQARFKKSIEARSMREKTPERLAIREEVHKAKLKLYKRNLV